MACIHLARNIAYSLINLMENVQDHDVATLDARRTGAKQSVSYIFGTNLNSLPQRPTFDTGVFSFHQKIRLFP